MTFAFDVPIRVVVEAANLDEAAGELLRLEMLTVGTEGPLEIRRCDVDDVGWVRACRVCGCTDDDACEGGCSWLTDYMDDLCSTDDVAHAAVCAQISAGMSAGGRFEWPRS